jgi:hypothetical protein
MTIRQTIDIPVGLRHLDVPLPEECPVGRVNIELHITPARLEVGAELDLLPPQPEPMTPAETEAHTQYILRELAKAEQDIADGTVQWLTMEEFFADDDDDEL